jgi:hypothetical protein
MRKLLKITVGLLVTMIIALVVLFFTVDQIAEYAIDHAGTSALGVDTHIDGVSIGIISGQTTLKNLTIANPPGYNGSTFLELTEGELDASLSNLMGSRVDVDLIRLSGITLDIEQNSKGFNYAAILANARGEEKAEAESASPSKPAKEEPAKANPQSEEGKTYHINKILITDVLITANLLSPLGKVTSAKIPIKKIEMNDVGSEKGVLLSKLTVLVVEALLEAAASAGIKDLPGSVLESLGEQIGSSSGVSLGGLGIDTGSGLKSIGNKINESINSITGSGDSSLGNEIGNAIGEVFGGSKK